MSPVFKIAGDERECFVYCEGVAVFGPATRAECEHARSRLVHKLIHGELRA